MTGPRENTTGQYSRTGSDANTRPAALVPLVLLPLLVVSAITPAAASDSMVPRWPSLVGNSDRASGDDGKSLQDARQALGGSYYYNNQAERQYGASVTAANPWPADPGPTPGGNALPIWPDGADPANQRASGAAYWAEQDTARQERNASTIADPRDISAALQTLPPGQRGGYYPPPAPGYGQPPANSYILPGEQKALASLGRTSFVDNTRDAYRWMYNARLPRQQQAVTPTGNVGVNSGGVRIILDAWPSPDTAFQEWGRLQQAWPGVLGNATPRILQDRTGGFRLQASGVNPSVAANFCSSRQAQNRVCQIQQTY